LSSILQETKEKSAVWLGEVWQGRTELHVMEGFLEEVVGWPGGIGQTVTGRQGIWAQEQQGEAAEMKVCARLWGL
jgi:hypothetical protein